MGGIKHDMQIALDMFEVVQGETDNVLKAALRDASTTIKNYVEDNWPIASGRSLAGFELEETETGYSLVNDTEYTSFVHIHPNQDGPPALVYKLLDDAIPAVQEDVEAYISERVRELLERKG